MTETDDDLLRFEAHGAGPLPVADAQGWVEYESARIWYGSYGVGEPVVFLHGLFDNSEDWGYQVPALTAAGYRVILIDSRGRGRSTCGDQPFTHELLAAEIRAVLDTLGVETAAVVGWSDGASLGLILAMDKLSRVARVFAFAGSMDPSGLKPFTPSALLNRVFGRAKRDYARLSATPEGFDRMAAETNKLVSPGPVYSAAEIARIAVPVTIAIGEDDEFIKHEHAEYLARTIPGAALTVLPGVSHFAMLQRPDDFNAAIVAFLRRV